MHYRYFCILMRLYHVPRIIRFFYARKAIWQMPERTKTIYLSFDDGPTPEITDWILDQLDQYHAKATFFCVGENVSKYPEKFSEIRKRGHAIGNHTYNHLNGWKTKTAPYVENVVEANDLIQSRLFRPPYGRIKKAQLKLLQDLKYKIILWSVLTYDFDANLNKNESLNQIKKKSGPGSIIVFHDHQKAFENLKELLPETLGYFSENGFVFEKIVF